MRLHTWMFVLLIVAMAASVTPVQAQTGPNNVVSVRFDEKRPPDLLSEEEVERIARLQGETVYTVPSSPVSPDDQTILYTSDETIGFLNIQDGSTVVIDPELFGPFIPLPLLGFSDFAWLDNETLGSVALDLRAFEPEDAFVKLGINRSTLELSVMPLRLPVDTGLVSISPDLNRFLLVLFPEEAAGEEDFSKPVRVRIGHPRPASAIVTDRPVAPAAMQGRIAQAQRQHAVALQRMWMMQEGDETETVAVTPTSLDLLLYTVDQGSRYVTTIDIASALASAVWTPDGNQLAFSIYGLADFEDQRFIFDGALLSEEVYRDVTGNLPPSINPVLQNNNTYVMDTVSGAVQLLQPDKGAAAPPVLFASDWSPDGQVLLVEAWHPARIRGRTHPIYALQFSERLSYRFYDRQLRELGRFENNLFSSAAFASVVGEMVSQDELIFRAARGTDRHVYYYNRRSGEVRNLSNRAGAYYNVFTTNRSRQIVFTHTSFTEPPDIYRMGWDGRGLARLTWVGEELRVFANLRQDPVSFRLPNGQTRVGVLIQPAGAAFPPRNVPIIVWQQGGPGSAMINRWLTNVEDPYALLPSMGLALLVTPVAGRPGYTPAIFNSLADGSNFGAIDIDEQAAIVREMIRRGWTRQGRVGITGCSYGGYFTLQSIVRHPTLYSAANPQCALVDTITEWNRGYASLMPHLMGLPPFTIPQEYQNDSPSYNVSRIRTPVLTFHGTGDFLPIVQNENLHLQLVNRKVPARMVKFFGEGHGLFDDENQLYAAQEQVSWFRQYLR
ncbi:S9 family peptidase [Candidatus Chloroploca asiatica]|nr:prolyl oligopeptidase family serine peptidase [Candidatus Chloroploca asiatica]